MKICTRFLDYIENNDVLYNSPEWADLLAHAQKCPDCSFAMRQRAQMLEILNGMHELSFPSDLHLRIMAEVDSDSINATQTMSWIDSLLEKFLRPIEIGFSFACILMVALMLNLENEGLEQINPTSSSRPIQIVQHTSEPNPKIDLAPNQIEPVSQQEVKEFLARLERFNRLHQCSEIRPDENYLPELRLVNDWK